MSRPKGNFATCLSSLDASWPDKEAVSLYQFQANTLYSVNRLIWYRHTLSRGITLVLYHKVDIFPCRKIHPPNPVETGFHICFQYLLHLFPRHLLQDHTDTARIPARSKTLKLYKVQEPGLHHPHYVQLVEGQPNSSQPHSLLGSCNFTRTRPTYIIYMRVIPA